MRALVWFGWNCVCFLEELLQKTSGFALAGELEMTRLPELGPANTPMSFDPA